MYIEFTETIPIYSKHSQILAFWFILTSVRNDNYWIANVSLLNVQTSILDEARSDTFLIL